MRISHRVAVSGILTFHVVLVLLFFDPKVHVGGDDSDYIVASMDFLDGVAFPTWHGSLYPIFLSPFLSAFGVNVILFKVISVALGVFSLIFLCKAFYQKVPDRVLYFALSITGFSYTMVAYLSTTYSEPLFIFLQSLVVYFFSLLERPLSGARENRQYFITAALGLSAFLLSITRNVGLGVAIPFIIFFALEKRWRVHATFLAAFVFLHAVFLLLKKKVWGSGQLGIEGQLSRIALKNFYDPADGKEDVAGFAIRFWENSNLYLSKHLAALLGLRPSTAATVWPLLTVIFYCLFVVAAVIAYKKNKLIFFLLLYVAVLLSITFITQQTHWDQVRLVLVYLPLVALPLGFLLQQLIDKRQAVASSFGKTMLILLPCLVLLRTLSTENNFFTTVTNLTRDRYHGYPDEWRNYALVSAWAGEHIDSNKNILCRKAGLSTVYGGRQFEGLSRFVHDNPDSADQLLFRKGIDYVILDDLDMPTVKRLLSYYLMKYPLGLKVVYTQGQRNASSLLEVIRTPPADDSAYFERVGAGLRIMPEASYFHVLAADKYQSLKDFPRAVQFYSSALQVAKTVAEKCAIRLNRGKVFLQLREVEKARKDFNTVLSYNPNDPEAIRALNVIDRLAEQTHRIK